MKEKTKQSRSDQVILVTPNRRLDHTHSLGFWAPYSAHTLCSLVQVPHELEEFLCSSKGRFSIPEEEGETKTPGLPKPIAALGGFWWLRC